METVFDKPARLLELLAPPSDPSDEATCNFPLAFYEQFLREIKRLGIQVITYRDLFDGSDDWDYRSKYPHEFKRWSKSCDPRAMYLVLQHDVDVLPHFTQRMIAMEALYGFRSNIFIFRDRISRLGKRPPYDIDHAFFQEAERNGFVIGYHQNALQLSEFDIDRAVERFRSDVEHLRRLYDIQFFVPHGGRGREIDGVMRYNVDVPMPPELESSAGRMRWVYNGYGPKFALTWSDGGISLLRDHKRTASLDIIKMFLHKLRPGTRNFALIHPQRWGYNLEPGKIPLLAEQPWYQRMCAESPQTPGLFSG